MHSALGDKLKEVQFTTLEDWGFNEKQLNFIEAVLKDYLTFK